MLYVRIHRLLWLSVATLLAIAPAHASNFGGSLVLAWQEDLSYTAGQDYCWNSTFGSCEDLPVRYDGTDPVVLYLLAVFDPRTESSFRGVTFGIDYAPARLRILEIGSCGSFAHTTPNWPEPGEGTLVNWGYDRTDTITEICWFAVQSEHPFPSSLEVIDHPTIGSRFFDEDGAGEGIEYLGSFGFFEEGVRQCAPPIGACCLYYDRCLDARTQEACEQSEGVWLGDGSSCDDAEQPCVTVSGACCFGDGTCQSLTYASCETQSGWWLGFLSCELSNCGSYRIGACCIYANHCEIREEQECWDHGGEFLGEGTRCGPGECDYPPVLETSWGAIKAHYR